MPHRCLLCGALGAACGTPTVGRVEPVDAPLRGYVVAGDKVLPDISSIRPADMNEDEAEEFSLMSAAYERRRLRNQIGRQAMADGKVPFTMLSYVLCEDGITRKMKPDVAAAYVELHPGTEITREGGLPQTKEGEVIGATKARMGNVEMFDENGRQREEVQPLNSRTFYATDRINPEATTPAVGTHGAASEDTMIGNGSLTTSATGGGDVNAGAVPNSGTDTASTGSGNAQKPSMRRHAAAAE